MLSQSRFLSLLLILLCLVYSLGRLEGRGPRPEELGASPLPIGETGVVWYATWENALTEATRSQRPIFFMAAAAQCGSISGIF